MRVDCFTIFPEAIEDYLRWSVLGRAIDAEVLEVKAHDLRSWAIDARGTLDDTPFGGGAGMVLKPEPLFAALEADTGRQGPVLYLSPAGRPFSQSDARRLAEGPGFSMICGRYEGLDQRVLDELVDEEVSVGDAVVAGGELPALMVLEAVARLVPGVLGNGESANEESNSNGLLEYPQYTKPASFRGLEVPEVLRSGNHGAVAAWRRAQSLQRTLERRPDLIAQRGGLSAEEAKILEKFGELEPPASAD